MKLSPVSNFKTKKECYMYARVHDGCSNLQIAKAYGVKPETVRSQIGSDKKYFEEKEKKEEMFDEKYMFDDGENATTANNVRETIEIACCDCGETFEMSPAEQKFYEDKGYSLPRRCSSCREKRKQFEVHTCCDCNAEFQMKLTEKEYYEKNGLHIPRRCPACREAKRKHNSEITNK